MNSQTGRERKEDIEKFRERENQKNDSQAKDGYAKMVSEKFSYNTQ